MEVRCAESAKTRAKYQDRIPVSGTNKGSDTPHNVQDLRLTGFQFHLEIQTRFEDSKRFQRFHLDLKDL